jgi:predicted ATPase/class 3 adenylate cyclase/DNA-binding CsgD family transcriptional regulator
MADHIPALPAGVVTFLLTDVEGSTRQWESEPEAMPQAIARHYELLDAAIALHGGVRPEEQGEGDSVVGAFARASDAVAAALDAQRALLQEPWPLTRPLRVRMALHSGEAQLRDDANYFGPAIIRCARLRAAGHGAQVLMSATTHHLVADRLPAGATICDLGAHRLKDLGRPEQVWQLCHPDLIGEFPSLRSLNSIPNNLPVQLSSFVGRETELAELRKALAGSRVVTLTGAGGCGKTRLAVQSAADMLEEHGDGAWWVELASVSTPEHVPNAVARALGLREEEGRPLIETLAEQLAEAGALLVLDNCEQVLDASARLIETLVRAAPRLRVLATSREPLGIPGEVTWRVPSLDEESAVRLFIERAAQVRPGFSPDATETEVVRQICLRLDGIALAIELAAARVRMMHPSRIAAALDDRFRILTGGGRTVMPRQQTLETSVAWSYDLLDDDERAVLRRLSVFAGGFGLEAAEAVCGDERVDRYAVLDVLSRLVDKSLVQVDESDGTYERYRLLETIRLYARQRLVESNESDATRDRHLTYYLDLAEQGEPELARGRGPAWLIRLECEHDNLRVALEWADATAAYEPSLRLATALTLFWELRGHLGEGGRWFARVLARDEGPSATRARALWGAAHVALYGDDFATALERGPEALEMAQAVGDDWATGRALNTLGYLQLQSEPEPARTGLQQSVAIGRKTGDDWAVADGLKMLTVAWAFQDDYDGIGPALEELLTVASALDNKFFIAWYHCCVGWVGVHRGDLAAARRALETSVELCHEVGEPATGGIAIALLGEIDARTGQYDAAEGRLGAFLQRAAATGGAMGAPFALITLASLAAGRGDLETARAYLDPLLEQVRTLGLPAYVAMVQAVAGAVLLSSGEVEAAEAALLEGKASAEAIGNPWMLSNVIHQLGRVAECRGDAHEAEDLHHEALALRASRGLHAGVVESLEALASLAAANESRAEATRLLAAAAAERAREGSTHWPLEEAARMEELATLRAALGDTAFEGAWAEGWALALSDAVAYATRARGERKRPSSGWAGLTPTEREVVKLLAQGLTNPQIGERLFIGRGTVKTHVAHVFTKVGVSTRAELAAEATRRGV